MILFLEGILESIRLSIEFGRDFIGQPASRMLKTCRTCETCVSRKGPAGKGKSSLQIYNVGIPFERLQMDSLDPLPTTSSGNRYLLVVVDCFTKWVKAIFLRNIRVKTVAEVFVSQIISRHGVPLEIHTDQG